MYRYTWLFLFFGEIVSKSSGLLQRGVGFGIRQIWSCYDHKNYMAVCINWEGGPFDGCP